MVIAYRVKSLRFYLILRGAVLRGAVGAIGGVGEVSFRKLLAFSSINHLG